MNIIERLELRKHGRGANGVRYIRRVINDQLTDTCFGTAHEFRKDLRQ